MGNDRTVMYPRLRRVVSWTVTTFALLWASSGTPADADVADAVASADLETAAEEADVTRHTVTAVTPLQGESVESEPDAEDDGDACAEGMVLVEGEYCTRVKHRCKKWLDDSKLPFARCGEYEPKATCVGKRVHKKFCIDKYEYTQSGAQLPLNHQSFVTARRVCKAQGKRLCLESEWNFACEGEEMRPYPYGWKREPVCNYDREDLYIQTPRKRLLADHRQPAESNPECVSPFGVVNMVGNLDETTFRDGAQHNHPYRNALKGGWWMAARNRCRPATTAHDDYYEDIQVGVRCCADAPGGGEDSAM